MAAETYYLAEIARRDAAKANDLASTAHALLRAISATRRELARTEAAGDPRCEAHRIKDRWMSACDSRNWIIRQWQDLTGRQWETYGDNLTRA